MQVVPLRSSQFIYHGRTACSYTHLFLCHWLLFSESRIDAEPAIEHWIRIGCFQFHQDTPHRHYGRLEDAFFTPMEAYQVSEFLMAGLQYQEDMSGTLQLAHVAPVATTPQQLVAHLVQNPSIHTQSGDRQQALGEFVKEAALMPLWRCLRRMFYFALWKPMAATYTSYSQQICSIGMRWNETTEERTRAEIRGRFYAMGDDAESAGARRHPNDYDLSLRPSLQELDANPGVAAHFYLDFLDTHSNSARDGLPVPLEDGGSAVWIRFTSLVALCQYLIRRYGHGSEPRFDLTLWEQPHNPDGSGKLSLEHLGSSQAAAMKIVNSLTYQSFVTTAESRL